ncbi:winged helix-turn-helix domain-containing protein [Amycolatopsis suaedae]|uniref:winged helix-turn-helix domain-containing protein n=1 Tax=Amycolatopsis suaedae TaxID=2510978 RepID=UPI002695BEBD
MADLTIDLAARRVQAHDTDIALTPKEFDLLAILARRVGVAVSRQQLMDEIWGTPTLRWSNDQNLWMVLGGER